MGTVYAAEENRNKRETLCPAIKMLNNYIFVEEKESKENKRKKWNAVDVVEENRSKRKQLVL